MFQYVLESLLNKDSLYKNDYNHVSNYYFFVSKYFLLAIKFKNTLLQKMTYVMVHYVRIEIWMYITNFVQLYYYLGSNNFHMLEMPSIHKLNLMVGIWKSYAKLI